MRTSRGPVAAYAAVLDGRHLWLALPGEYDGTLVLRPADGDAIPLEAEPQGRWLAVRADLTALLPAGDATYDVLLKGSRLLPAKPVGAPRLERSLTRTPTTPDGRTRFTLTASDDGLLRLHRSSEPPTAVLEAIELRGDRVHLELGLDGDPGHLLLLDQDDAVLATLPTTAHQGRLEALVGLDDLPAGWFGMLRVAVGTAGSHRRVRRRADDLVDAHRAVLLPELVEDGEPRARFRWNPEGLLAVRHLAPGETA